MRFFTGNCNSKFSDIFIIFIINQKLAKANQLIIDYTVVESFAAVGVMFQQLISW